MKYDVVVGKDPLRADEKNYFYCDGTNDSKVIQAAIDYLYMLKPDATFPVSKENVQNVGSKMKDLILFSDRMVRGCLDEQKSLSTIAKELKMTEHHVLTSLLKLYKNGEINWYNVDKVPEFYLTLNPTQTLQNQEWGEKCPNCKHGGTGDTCTPDQDKYRNGTCFERARGRKGDKS